MTATRQTGGRLASSVLVILVPVLLLAVLGLLTSGMALGTLELLLLAAIWVVGHVWVWRPRRHTAQEQPSGGGPPSEFTHAPMNTSLTPGRIANRGYGGAQRG